VAAAKGALRIYLDTSVLLAMICPEPDTQGVLSWYRQSQQATLVSTPWIRTELSSALGIKRRTQQLSDAEVPLAWHAGQRILQTTVCEALVSADFDAAADFCAEHALKLRGPDALHLAAARRLGCTEIATLDELMSVAAVRLGLVALALK